MTPKKDAFLELFSQTGNVSLAAKGVETSRQSVYRWRHEDAEFATAWNDAEQTSHDRLEAEAFRRAHDGVEDFKVGPNGQFVEMRRYSDTLLIFLLKARRPEKYRENVNMAISGPDGGPITVEHRRRLTIEDVRAFDHELNGSSAGASR